MLKFSIIKLLSSLLIVCVLIIVPIIGIFIRLPIAYAATTPDLGTAGTFGVLSSTFTRNVGITAITGDLGYTTISGSGTSTVTGTTHTPTPTQSGTDQATALSALNAQSCDFSFGGATALSDLPQPLTPGVYCVTGAQSIGTGGITLSGAGTYIFRSTGALNTTDSSVSTLSGGASACDVFWTPVGTTLGANTIFQGTVIDTAAITVGSMVSWTGRALAYGLTVTTDTDTITVPSCASPTATPTPTPSPTPTSTPGSTPTPTPSPNPTSAAVGTSGGSPSSESGSSVCVSSVITTTPIIIESRRTSPSIITLSWGPYGDVNTFVIEYGLTNGEWIYNTKVTGFSTTLNDLPENIPLWIRIAASDNCAIGNYSTAFLIGGPHLPSTGIGPPQNPSKNIFTASTMTLRLWLDTLTLKKRSTHI